VPEPATPPVEGEAAKTPRPGLRHRVISSAGWIGLGFGYSQLVRLAGSVVMAHLLFPQAFGLMALAVTFLTGLVLFSDLGIRTSVVQSPRGDDPEFLDTAWTLQIIRGLILWLASCALAWPAAWWRPQPEPDLVWLLPLFGLTAAIDGFTSTKVLSLHRHLDQRRAVLLEALIQTLATGTMIVWALSDPGVTALAAGPILGSVCRAVLSHLVLPGQRNRLRWDRASLKELVQFARWIYLGTVLTFLAGNLDRLVIGYLSITTLGVYHIAAQLTAAAILLMASVSGQLVFPLYSRMVGAGRELMPVFRRVHPAAGAAGAVLIAGVMGAGPTLIRLLYDSRYHDAGWILPLLAIGAWFQILEANAGSVLFATGRPKVSALSNAVKVLCLAIFIPLGTWLDGIRGLVLGLVLGDVARYLTTAIALRRHHFNVFRIDLAWTLFVAIAGFGSLLLGRLMLPNETPRPGLLQQLICFAVQGAVVVVAGGVIVLILKRKGVFAAPPPAVESSTSPARLLGEPGA
jgi:O-antigen/teichoic acid export membrane protein